MCQREDAYLKKEYFLHSIKSLALLSFASLRIDVCSIPFLQYDLQRVDLRNLETPALKKYCAAHGVAVSSDASRNVLLAAACGHFSRFQVEEMDVIRRLIAVSGNGRSATPSSYC